MKKILEWEALMMKGEIAKRNPTHTNNSPKKKIQKKLIFNQYLEIGERLRPNFANFNLDFLAKYR